MRAEPSLEKIPLVCEYPTAVAQREMFRCVGNVRHSDQFHCALVRQAVALEVVAAPARRYDVLPTVCSAPGLRRDVVPCESPVRESASAVHAPMVVPSEQGDVCDGWFGALAPHNLASARDNGVDVQMDSFSGRLGYSANQTQNGIPHRPSNQLATVEARSLAPVDPANGMACDVQAKHARHSFKLVKRG